MSADNYDEKVRNQFHDKLKEYRTKRDKASISNRFPWQTRMATLELLEHAISTREPVRILTGTACEQFYCDDVTKKLETCLRVGCEVRVLIWNDHDCVPGDSLYAISREYPNQMEIRISGTRELGDQISHFLLVGKNAYRLEQEHRYLDHAEWSDLAPETKARICFNDVEGGAVLHGFFEKLWEVCDRAKAKINMTAGSGLAPPGSAGSSPESSGPSSSGSSSSGASKRFHVFTGIAPF